MKYFIYLCAFLALIDFVFKIATAPMALIVEILKILLN